VSGRAARVAAALAFAAAAGCAAAPVVPRRCPQGAFDGSFIQLSDRERAHDGAAWERELAVLRSVGVELVILQFSGDELGPHDRDGRAPVRALLEASGALGMPVLLGLHFVPDWPAVPLAQGWLPPPLPDADELLGLCAAHPHCLGVYIPQELDDYNFGGAQGRALARDFLRRTSAALRARLPGKLVAIAPYFAGHQDPAAHARFWREVLADRPVDIFMLQDGVGTGRATAAEAARYLEALAPVVAEAGARLWSVVELFQQLHGPPIDGRAFRAKAAQYPEVRERLRAERPHVERIVAFSVLDYMNPDRGLAARGLHRKYAGWCDEAAGGGAASSPAQ
jgi:sugar phosphate isomerase/epimerase